MQTPAERSEARPRGELRSRSEDRSAGGGGQHAGGRRAPAPAAYGVEARLHKSHWLSKNVPASGSWLGVAAEGLGVYGPTPADRSPGPAVTLLYKDN